MTDPRFAQPDAPQPDEPSLGQLVEALNDESWRVRRLAADRLAKLEPSAELLDALIGLLGQRGQTGARNAAAMVLGQLGGGALQSLVLLLGHRDPDQRKLAADILGELRRPEAVPALSRALNDPDANVRSAAAEALGRIGGPEAVAALEALLTTPAEPLLYVSALEGLAALRAAPALATLRPLLSNPLTRRSAHRVLALIAHPTAWSLLVLALRTPKSRDAALTGLGVRSARLPADLEPDVTSALRHMPDARDWLAGALVGDDLGRRRGALLVVPALQDPSLAPDVAKAVEGVDSSDLTPLALEALLRLGVPGARALVVGAPPAVLHLGRESRAVAGEAIWQLASPALVEPLQALLDAGDDELADLATRALGRTGATSAIGPLVALFGNDQLSAQARRSLVQLAQSWPHEVQAQLRPVVERSLQPHAVRAFGAIARSAASDVLRRALHDENDAVRAAALESVPALENEGVAFVAAAFVDESARVRRAAARALGSMTTPAARPVLERALHDREPSVLAVACGTAAEWGAHDTRPRLAELARHSDVGVVMAALGALAALGCLDDALVGEAFDHRDPEVVKHVLTLAADRPALIARAPEALRHDRWDVRVAAARALAAGGQRESLAALREAVARETDSLAQELLEAAAAALASR